MRCFIVLGFHTTRNSELGQPLHLGSDRGEAIATVNEPDGEFARKQLYELTTPHLTRHFEVNDDPVNDDPVEVTNSLQISDAAKKLADERGLTDVQLSEITPTGSSGNIIKGDIEKYLGDPGESQDGS